MYNHNKAQQSKNRVHISWDLLYTSGNVIMNSKILSPTECVFQWRFVVKYSMSFGLIKRNHVSYIIHQVFLFYKKMFWRLSFVTLPPPDAGKYGFLYMWLFSIPLFVFRLYYYSLKMHDSWFIYPYSSGLPPLWWLQYRWYNSEGYGWKFHHETTSKREQRA